MKICVRCKQLAQDNEPYCKRCGSNQFAAYNQTQQASNQNIRPQQMQGQRPQQLQRGQMQGQRMQQMQGQMHTQNVNNTPNQFMGNQGQPQRPQQQNYNQLQQQVQNTNISDGYTMDDFQDEPVVETKKKMFKSRADKKAEMYAQMNQMQAMKNGNQVNYDNIQNSNINNIPDNGVITFKDWIMTMIFLVIPIWNIIYLIKSLNNPVLNESKKNYLKAYLLYTVVATVISIIITFTATLLGMAVL